MAQAPAIRAAVARESASVALVRRAGTWRNPVFSVTAENLFAEVQTTGKSGLAGIEGQAIIEQTLTLGGDRGAAISEARALAGVAGATWAGTEADLRVQAVEAIALADRDAAIARFSAQESVALRQVAAMMARRAAEGRSSGGDAALAALEAASAASLAARRGAQAAESQAELARVVGAAPGEYVKVETSGCPATPVADRTGAGLPNCVRADFSVAAADAAVARRQCGARARPPTVGRPSPHPGFLRPVARPRARHPHPASPAPRRSRRRASRPMPRATIARRWCAWWRRAMRARGRRSSSWTRRPGVFDAQLVSDLERAVRSAESRYAAGEGTLVELLITRRARLVLLTEYEEWRAAQRIARARKARLSGIPIDAEMLCDSNGRQLQ